MIKVGLIGYGTWGKILYKKLEMFCDVKFMCNSKETYLDKLDDIDWTVVATPDDTHFEIVRNCLCAGKNVFCEKPLTLTYKESEELFNIAKSNDVKLYVDDVQNYREYDFEILENNLVERRKLGGNLRDVLYVLAYHDLYVLYKYIKYSEIETITLIDNKNILHFKIKFNDISIEFVYDTNYEDERLHNINGVSLMGDGTDDPLNDMLKKVIVDNNVDFQYNKKITLFTNNIIDILNRQLL